MGVGDHRHAAPIGIWSAPLKTASVAVQAIGGVPLDDDQVDNDPLLRCRRRCRHEARECHDCRPNGRVHPGDDADGRGPDGNPYNRAVRKAEQALNAKVRETLAYIPNVTVTSTMTFDHGKGSRSLEANTDPKSANREAASSGGAAEIQTQGGANQPASLGAGGNKASNETGDESKIEQVNVVNTTTAEKDSFGRHCEEGHGFRRHPGELLREGLEGAEPDQRRRRSQEARPGRRRQDPREDHAGRSQPGRHHIVATRADVKDAASLVTVTTFQDFKPAEIQVPPPAQRALTWLGQNWPMMAMVGLVLFSLGMLRSMFRSVPAPSRPRPRCGRRPPRPSPKRPTSQSKRPLPAASAARPARALRSATSFPNW